MAPQIEKSSEEKQGYGGLPLPRIPDISTWVDTEAPDPVECKARRIAAKKRRLKNKLWAILHFVLGLLVPMLIEDRSFYYYLKAVDKFNLHQFIKHPLACFVIAILALEITATIILAKKGRPYITAGIIVHFIPFSFALARMLGY